MLAIRRLGVGDEGVVIELANEDEAFDLDEPGRRRSALDETSAAQFLADDHVLHWAAEEGGLVVGHLLCYLQRRRVDDPFQLLLYDIGVRRGHRRRGIGRALLAEMERWMKGNGVREVWLLADEEAEPFYAACGFVLDDVQPVQMSRRV